MWLDDGIIVKNGMAARRANWSAAVAVLRMHTVIIWEKKRGPRRTTSKESDCSREKKRTTRMSALGRCRVRNAATVEKRDNSVIFTHRGSWWGILECFSNDVTVLQGCSWRKHCPPSPMFAGRVITSMEDGDLPPAALDMEVVFEGARERARAEKFSIEVLDSYLGGMDWSSALQRFVGDKSWMFKDFSRDEEIDLRTD